MTRDDVIRLAREVADYYEITAADDAAEAIWEALQEKRIVLSGKK